ncbi:GNAT superfamily N-acetyltransferase [Catenulispora sp. MAP12-49]|uniref:GNAT family N-acetyltransferase n=1 Tax=Catenulispora sp. MAP12-49 TaxID=3156302 RepID=UPI0035135AF5
MNDHDRDRDPRPGLGGRPVRVAAPEDLAALPALESAADALLADYLDAPLPPGPDTEAAVAALARAAAVLVAGTPPVGFARIDVVDGGAHLEQLAVDPAFARRGLGTALVRGCCDWAVAHGFDAVTLTTFAQVPFNGPFYARLGFAVVDDAALPTELAGLRRHEAEVGLDALGPRVVMRRASGLGHTGR